LLMLGGISDKSILSTLRPLGVCALSLTGMDTDILFSGAAARVGEMRSQFPLDDNTSAAR
jgi:hypothetical protein